MSAPTRRNRQKERGQPILSAEAKKIHVAPHISLSKAFQIIGHACLNHLLANEAAMLAGNLEALHQMRVAVRRLRAAMSVFSQIVADNKFNSLKSELKWIAAQLAPARDLDVVLHEVMKPLHKLHSDHQGLKNLEIYFTKQRSKAYQNAKKAMNSARFRTFVMEISAWIAAAQWEQRNNHRARRKSKQSIESYAAKKLFRHWKKVKKKGKKLIGQTAQENHRLRIKVKKLRYAVEFFADAFSGKMAKKRRKALSASLKQLQESLGELHDIAMRRGLSPSKANHSSRSHSARSHASAIELLATHQNTKIKPLLKAATSAYSCFATIKPFWG
jgi:CHAD domain-containing protein